MSIEAPSAKREQAAIQRPQNTEPRQRQPEPVPTEAEAPAPPARSNDQGPQKVEVVA